MNDDHSGDVIQYIIREALFEGYEAPLSLETWTEKNSFIVKDEAGNKYRITVTKEN